MQQKRSVTFDDWKEAYKMGFDGFILGCGEKTAQGYIDKFSEMAEVKGMPVFRSDGVHVVFKREKAAAPVMGVKNNSGFSFYLKVFAIGFLLTFFVWMMVAFFVEEDINPVIDLSKTVIVQKNIIPRECYMIPSKLEEGGYSVMVVDLDSEFRCFIEMDDYDSFFSEYLEKR